MTNFGMALRTLAAHPVAYGKPVLQWIALNT